MSATPRLDVAIAWRALNDPSAPINWPAPDYDAEFLERHHNDRQALTALAIHRAASGAPATLPARRLPPPVTGDWQPPRPPPAPPGYIRRTA